MIASFRHRGLKRLFERGDRSGISAVFVDKVERILARLDAADSPAEVDAPGFGLHALRGDLAGFWAVTVSRNWRVVFRFEMVRCETLIWSTIIEEYTKCP